MKKKTKKFLKKTLFLIILILIIIILLLFYISFLSWKKQAIYLIQNEHTISLSYDEIPKNLINAYISIEDERFYKHHGIDIKRTTAAIGSYIINFGHSDFGGSSITQQLVKNLTGENSNTVSRKAKEWIKAIQLEMFLSKEDILETYFNIIYTGPNIYGVQSASKYYFNKNVDELSLAECAYLAGINIAPNAFNPFDATKDNSQKITKRVKTVLDKMEELGYITREQYDESAKEAENLNFVQPLTVSTN